MNVGRSGLPITKDTISQNLNLKNVFQNLIEFFKIFFKSFEVEIFNGCFGMSGL